MDSELAAPPSVNFYVYYDDILSKLEEGGEVDAIYLDFSKAFDKVDHNILLMKIANLKIGGKILTWIESFLRRRRQVVKVKNEYSKQEKVVSGVPQGSVLGPLLFIILMIDINDSIMHAALGSYADDTRLWHTIINLLNANELQEELSKIYVWADLNNMTFNNDKFEMMSFTSTNHPTNRNPLYLSPSGETLSRKEVIKDLGIQFDEKLTFHTHIVSTAAKGLRMAGWTLRTFKSRGRQLMLTLLKSLIIPHLEYASVVWSPTDMHHINLLENVQRGYTSKIACFQTYDEALGMPVCTTDYPSRLKDLNIYSLQRRRERYMIIYIYKIVIHLVTNPGFEIVYNPRTKITVKPKYNNQSSNWVKKARRSSFFVQGPRLYNSIPNYLRELEDTATPSKANVDCFKRSLDIYLTGILDVPGTLANSICPQLV